MRNGQHLPLLPTAPGRKQALTGPAGEGGKRRCLRPLAPTAWELRPPPPLLLYARLLGRAGKAQGSNCIAVPGGTSYAGCQVYGFHLNQPATEARGPRTPHQ